MMAKERIKLHLASRKLQALSYAKDSFCSALANVPLHGINLILEYADGIFSYCDNDECERRARESRTFDTRSCGICVSCGMWISDTSILDLAGQWVDIALWYSLMRGWDMGDVYWMADYPRENHLEVDMSAFIVQRFRDLPSDALEKQRERKHYLIARLNPRYTSFMLLDDQWSPFFAAYVLEVYYQAYGYQESQYCEVDESECLDKLLTWLKTHSAASPAQQRRIFGLPHYPVTPSGNLQELPILRSVSPWHTPERKAEAVINHSIASASALECAITENTTDRLVDVRSKQAQADRQWAKQSQMWVRSAKLAQEFAREKKAKQQKHAKLKTRCKKR